MKLLKYVVSLRWANALSELTGWLSAAALLAATGVMMHGVALRYFFGQPTVWQTEVSIYLLMFVAFVGGAYGIKHHAHVGVDLLVDRLPDKPRLVVRLVTSVLVLGVVLAVAWSAGHEWMKAIEGGWTSPTAFRAPLSIVYGIVPVGMVLIALQMLAFIVEGVLGLMGRLEPGRAAALLAQGNAELAAATNVAGEGVTDEGVQREVGDAGPTPDHLAAPGSRRRS